VCAGEAEGSSAENVVRPPSAGEAPTSTFHVERSRPAAKVAKTLGPVREPRAFFLVRQGAKCMSPLRGLRGTPRQNAREVRALPMSLVDFFAPRAPRREAQGKGFDTHRSMNGGESRLPPWFFPIGQLRRSAIGNQIAEKPPLESTAAPLD